MVKQKLFIIKKYVLATSASDALSKERFIKPDDVWVDENWRTNNILHPQNIIGYKICNKKKQKSANK